MSISSDGTIKQEGPISQPGRETDRIYQSSLLLRPLSLHYSTIGDPQFGMHPADWLPPPLHYADLELHSVGPGEDAKEKATRLGGIVAFGWYIQEGFRRGLHIEGCRKVHGLDDIPCWGGH